MEVDFLWRIFIFLLFANIIESSNFDIFSTNNLTYGRDYLYIEFRVVKSTANTPINLTVYKEVKTNVTEIVKTDFANTTWTNKDIEKRACWDTINGGCASVFYFQLSTDTVHCTDTGSYNGEIVFSDGTMSKKQVYIEVKVIPDQINPIKLLSGQNDSLPFPVGSSLLLQCSGNVGDPPQNLHWCIQRSTDTKLSNYDETGDISMGKQILNGCQYTQTSNITYVVSDKDRSTTIRCYTGDYGSCTDNSIPYVEYKVKKATVNSGNKIGFGFSLLALVVVVITSKIFQ